MCGKHYLFIFNTYRVACLHAYTIAEMHRHVKIPVSLSLWEVLALVKP